MGLSMQCLRKSGKLAKAHQPIHLRCWLRCWFTLGSSLVPPPHPKLAMRWPGKLSPVFPAPSGRNFNSRPSSAKCSESLASVNCSAIRGFPNIENPEYLFWPTHNKKGHSILESSLSCQWVPLHPKPASLNRVLHVF